MTTSADAVTGAILLDVNITVWCFRTEAIFGLQYGCRNQDKKCDKYFHCLLPASRIGKPASVGT
jgi:hypothetical protein